MTDDRRHPVFRILHTIILVSILCFAAVVVIIKPRTSAVVEGLWQWTWVLVAAIAVFGAGVIKGRLAGEADLARVRVGAILIWGLAEGAAFVGLVFALITGSWLPVGGAVIGLALLFLHGPSTFRR